MHLFKQIFLVPLKCPTQVLLAQLPHSTNSLFQKCLTIVGIAESLLFINQREWTLTIQTLEKKFSEAITEVIGLGNYCISCKFIKGHKRKCHPGDL